MKKGFSLIEVLIVVGIVGVLASIVIPAYNKYQSKAALRVINASITNISKALEACLTLKPLSECDSYSEIGIKCDSYGRAGTAGAGTPITHSSPLPPNQISIRSGSYNRSIIKGLHCGGEVSHSRGFICLDVSHEKLNYKTACTDNQGNTIKLKHVGSRNGGCFLSDCR